MNEQLKDKAKGAFIGMAIGDALGQPTEGKTLDEIRLKWGYIKDFLSDDPCGSDDTEFALFSSRLLCKYGLKLTSDIIADEWVEDIGSQKGAFKGAGFSELMAIENLMRGVRPPYSGEHLHSWSDGLAMRVAPYGIAAAGNPALAIRLAEIDGVVSHSGEGIFSGKAVAAAISVAMVSNNLEKIFDAALHAAPADSWTAQSIKEGISIGKAAGSVEEALKPLNDKLVCNFYHWADLAPEAVGLSFGLIAASQGNFEQSVTGGTNIGRDTDTIAAIAGAITGAMEGFSALPVKWTKRIQKSKGSCIHSVKGIDIADMALELLNANIMEVF